ncbi:hypothetical protein AAG747_13185 [Rapidithrix thailandica]|uniref:Cell division protein FtsQ n=1 Tax=Rapidithrix thailandica TaxID=413964 RepID=A0AAW9S939_9BACT
MMQKWNIKPGWVTLIAIVVLMAIGAMVGFKAMEENQTNFIINIDDESGSEFINEWEVKELINKLVKEDSSINHKEELNLKQLEQALNAIDFVKEAQVSRDLRDNVIIDVYQETPLARVMASSGKGGYVSVNRRILSLSDNYTARVMMITGAGADSLLTDNFWISEQGKALFEFIEFVNKSEEWRAQISQIDLNSKLEIVAFPQIGRQRIEFGPLENYELKFKKLNVFYNEIVKKEGWNAYEVVKLQYDGQIVCK